MMGRRDDGSQRVAVGVCSDDRPPACYTPLSLTCCLARHFNKRLDYVLCRVFVNVHDNNQCMLLYKNTYLSTSKPGRKGAVVRPVIMSVMMKATVLWWHQQYLDHFNQLRWMLVRTSDFSRWLCRFVYQILQKPIIKTEFICHSQYSMLNIITRLLVTRITLDYYSKYVMNCLFTSSAMNMYHTVCITLKNQWNFNYS